MHWYLRILTALEIIFIFIIFGSLLAGSTLLTYDTIPGKARYFTRPIEFDFVSWTVNALGIKFGQATIASPYYFTPTNQHQVVVDYFHLMDNILQDEIKLDLMFADPTIKDPETASAALRAELNGLYAQQDQMGPMAESILQAQVSYELAKMDLTTGGQAMPPLLFHMTPLPFDLVISPRDKIVEAASISLDPTLSVDRQSTLEGRVDKGMNVSSLVVPIGGIGTYPTMVERTTALDWLSSTIAHEWTHNWLTWHPLGLNYDTNAQLRTMNETTADIVGGEVGKAMLKQFYPELVAKYSMTGEAASMAEIPSKAGFDFNSEMHTTRVHVDALLAQGKISEAENYMDQRRLIFWNNGYPIRKLNQAYFAFYGAYADVPGGAAGEDPVGPAVRALRAQSASLSIFLHRIAEMSSFKQLQEALSN